MITIELTEHEIMRLRKYGNSLPASLQKVYEELLGESYGQYGSISITSDIDTWALLLLSVVAEQHKVAQEGGLRFLHGTQQATHT